MEGVLKAVKMYYKRTIIMITVINCAIVLCSCGKANKEYNEAVELIEDGKYEEAILHLETAIKKNDERAEYYIAYGMALNAASRYKEAVKEFGKAYQDTDNEISGQNNKKLFLGQAVAYYGLNDYNKVIEVCDKALAIDQYGYMDEKLGKMKAAAAGFMENFDLALETYNSLLEDNSLADIYFERAGLYEKLGDIKKAAKDYESAIKADKKCYDAYFALYNIYKNDKKNVFKDSSKLADDVISLITDAKMESADEILQLGRAYYYMGDYSSAVSSLEKSLKGGCNEALYYLGTVKMAEKNYKEASSKFNEYISKTGDTSIQGTNVAQAYNQLAGCYILLGDYENAESYINKGIALGTTSARRTLIKNRVILYEKTAQYKKARKAARQYLNEFPDDDGMKKELLFINTRIRTVSLGREAARASE